MELFTLDRNFHKQEIIDEFGSIIWTERYGGDSEVELVMPLDNVSLSKLSIGTFLGIGDSDEVMILETANFEDNKIKFKGISLLPWLDNRFVRTSKDHTVKYWYISNMVPGQILAEIISKMCVAGSPYLTGATPTGIANPQQLAIPGLRVSSYDTSGTKVKIGVPYGPVFAAMKQIADTYGIGQQIILEDVSATSYSLGYRNYKGVDRTSAQTVNAILRFSPQSESFADIKEVQSIAKFKTRAYAFAPENPNNLAVNLAPGVANLSDQYTGFDLRAMMILADDISTDEVGGVKQNLLDILTSRAKDGLATNPFVAAVDGEIVPDSQIKYGRDYGLGDLIEVQGNSGTVNIARVTEYIRSQDNTGEKAYPTVTVIS